MDRPQIKRSNITQTFVGHSQPFLLFIVEVLKFFGTDLSRFGSSHVTRGGPRNANCGYVGLRFPQLVSRAMADGPGWEFAYPLVMTDIAIENHHFHPFSMGKSIIL